MALISRSTVGLRFWGSDLDPETITQLLGHAPSSAAKTGETLTPSRRKVRIVKEGFWHLNYGESDNVEIEEKIETLLGKLTDDLNVWQEITKNAKVDMFFGLFMDAWNEGFDISSKTLKKLSDRGIKISFDIYGSTQDTGFDNVEDQAHGEPK